MEMDQWTLVSRVVEFIDNDDMKQQVMQRAMMVREGSVVWRCMRARQHYRLSDKEREDLFQQAMDRGMWQLVKPLVEEKDRTGIQQRDTALLESIKQRQWDVVDYCQFNGADIDMEDEHGETPLNREVKWVSEFTEEKWKAAEELIVRGADPNHLDKEECSVLNIAIHNAKWGTVRLLIENLADIHKPAHSTRQYRKRSKLSTGFSVRGPFESKKIPLQLLIEKFQGDLIHHTLMWCPDQAAVVSSFGETTLHVIARSRKPEHLYFQVVRGVDPLKLTKEHESALLYAVLDRINSREMVAECIKLGFSIHQPSLTRQSSNNILVYVKRHGDSLKYLTSSPLLLAVLRGKHVVAHMLYESGSCSHAELLLLYGELLEFLDPNNEEVRKLVIPPKRPEFVERPPLGNSLIAKVRSLERKLKYYLNGSKISMRYMRRRMRYEAICFNTRPFLPCLKQIVNTPRSLVSTCRLVISRSLAFHRRRERAVLQLTLPARNASGELDEGKLPLPEGARDYLLFSDLSELPQTTSTICSVPCPHWPKTDHTRQWKGEEGDV
jgi:ankyrin repeat protein